jgi:AraC-like DNA-binding protein
MYEQSEANRYNSAVGSFWTHYSHTINGMTPWAERYTEVLQELTSRRDLRSLALINLSQVVNHKSALRDFYAWCPDCYAEQKEHGQEVYDYLLWTIDAVTVCPVHSAPLTTYCLSCGQEQRALSLNSRAGYCHHCNAWLGTHDGNNLTHHDPYSEEDWDWRMWKSHALGELIENVTHQDQRLSRANLQSALQAFVMDCADGNTNRLARWTDINARPLRSWKQGQSAPPLALLLHVCYRWKISPYSLLTHQSDITKSFDAKTVAQESSCFVHDRTVLFPHQTIKTALENALHEEPPVSFTELVRRLNQPRTVIRRQFKKESDALIERYKTWKQNHKGQPSSNTHARGAVATDLTIQQRLEQATIEELPISLAQVARELKCSTDTLKKWYPTQCALIQRRYHSIDWAAVEKVLEEVLQLQTPPYPSLSEISRRVGVLHCRIRQHYPEKCQEITQRHRYQNVDIMQRELQRAVSEAPPPSLAEISNRTGCTVKTLKRHFPEFCEEVFQRYTTFVQENALQRDQRHREEVRQAVLQVHSQGLYPSIGRLAPYLKHSLIMMEPACRDEWRATLEELGYDVDDDE